MHSFLDLETFPLDQPESDDFIDDPKIVWKFAVKPKSVLDKPLACEFEVPVFARR